MVHKLKIMIAKQASRKLKKYLTTCKQCGHYRFARMQRKRIINPTYPYEHSTKGGCTVPLEFHIKPGDKLRRICRCQHCVNAAHQFINDAPGLKQKNQYIYKRTEIQKVLWDEMKRDGWSCRRGRYFRFAQDRKGKGMNGAEAFELYQFLRDWMNGNG